LHRDAIDTGFISSLGSDFLTVLYRVIAADKGAFGFVAEDEDRVIGFVVFTTDLLALYRSVLRRGGIRFVGLLAGKLFSWQRSRRILETLRYPRRTDRQTLPRAELLAIAVKADRRAQGIGTELLRRGLESCRQRGVSQVKVCVGENRAPAQGLYERMGFKPVCEISPHGQTGWIWVKQVTKRNTRPGDQHD
jgi:ribosomal protein S18 acetylase RimI-like enzyme